MAGFGFSPSDIVEFGKFSVKVKKALKDDGGSASEFQEAIGWCESFQDVLRELQNLELSNVSVAFADNLQEQSRNTQQFVIGFKKTIAKYEKALGVDAKKGMRHGTARKVQWALMAAGDLDKFAQSLQLRIKSLEFFMASKTLANADQIPSLRIEAAQVGDSILDMRRTIVRIASQQDVFNSQLSNIFAEIRYLRLTGSPDLALKVMELNSTITQFLGNRGDIPPIEGVPRVWTLPDTMDYVNGTEESAVESFPSLRSRDDGKRAVLSRDDQLNTDAGQERITERPTDKLHVVPLAHSLPKDKEWVRYTNEVLRALQLPQLTVDFVEEIDEEKRETGSRGDAPIADADGVQDSEDRPTKSANHLPQNFSQRKGIWSKLRGFGGPVTGLEAAGAVIGVVALLQQLSISMSYQTAAMGKLLRIHQRLQDLTPLLEQVADQIARGEDLRGGRVILDRIRSLHAGMQRIVLSAGRWDVLMRMVRSIRKDEIDDLLEEMDSLRLTSMCTLQAHTARIQSQNRQILVDGMSKIEQLEERVSMLHNYVQPSASRGKRSA